MTTQYKQLPKNVTERGERNKKSKREGGIIMQESGLFSPNNNSSSNDEMEQHNWANCKVVNVGCCSRLNRKERLYFVCQLALLASFTLVEFLCGYLTKSQTLVADSLHMASDLAACLLFIFTRNLSRAGTSTQFPFGTARLEYIGSMLGSLFLLSLSFNIIINNLSLLVKFLIAAHFQSTTGGGGGAEGNKVERFADFVTLSNSSAILIVGALGFLVNVVSLCLAKLLIIDGRDETDGGKENYGKSQKLSRIEQASTTSSKSLSSTTNNSRDENYELSKASISKPERLNNFTMLLHIFNDLLGLVLVLITAATLRWQCPLAKDAGDSGGAEECLWKLLDPAASLLFASVLAFLSFRLVRKSVPILCQPRTSNSDLYNLKEEVAEHLGLVVTDYRFWDLVPGKTFGNLEFESTDFGNSETLRSEISAITAFMSRKKVSHCSITARVAPQGD